MWASASTATKVALEIAQPLVIAQVRFAVAGLLMLFLCHVVFKKPLPARKDFKFLSIYGLLNITIYLGCYVVAMQHVTAGVGALAIATNPLFISFLSVFFLKKKLSAQVLLGLFLGTAGVIYASWPLLQNAKITTGGLVLLLFSMLSYSAGAIYFSAKSPKRADLLLINGWQTFIGGILLLPFTLFQYSHKQNFFGFQFWSSTLWLAVAVSIFAVQLWLWLLRTNTVKAGLWLFLCPVFGFAIAAGVLGDPISSYTVLGVVLVLAGLYIAERNVKQ